MSRPCTCDRGAERAGPYTEDQCRLCWLYRHDAAYRAFWDSRSVLPSRPACRHRGAPTGETILCPSCGGAVALKLFVCTMHGSCTIARPVGDIACCANCPDYDTPLSPPGERGRG